MPLTCVNCGGSLETTATAELFRCQYCRQLMLLVRSGEATVRTATKLSPRREWAANCLRPGDALNWQGGALLLTDEALAFVPHAFNFGSVERAVVPVASIAAMKLDTGLISDDLTVSTVDGEVWGYRVRKGQDLHDAIQGLRETA